MADFQTTRKVEWGDCDPAGIVYYPRYFVMFDNATVALFAAAGLKKHEMVKVYDMIGYPMVDTGAKFFIPSKWGETKNFAPVSTIG